MNTKNAKISSFLLFIISILSLSSCSKQKKATEAEKKKLEQQKNINTEKYSQTKQKPKKSNPIALQKNKLTVKQKKLERRQQKKTGQTKTLSLMSFEELKKSRDILLQKNDKEAAIKFTQKMLTMAPTNDVQLISEITIELADLYFDLGKLKKAELVYTEYSRLYPGSKAIEYMSYKAILCSFYRTFKAENDQTKTNDTILLANAFIDRKNIFKQYIDEVETIRISCYKKMIESDVNVFNFYLNQGRLLSAQSRLENIRKNWLPKYPEVAHQIAQLEDQLKTKTIAMTKQHTSKSTAIAQAKTTQQPETAQKLEPETTVIAQAKQAQIQVPPKTKEKTTPAQAKVTPQAQDSPQTKTKADQPKSFTARF